MFLKVRVDPSLHELYTNILIKFSGVRFTIPMQCYILHRFPNNDFDLILKIVHFSDIFKRNFLCAACFTDLLVNAMTNTKYVGKIIYTLFIMTI